MRERITRCNICNNVITGKMVMISGGSGEMYIGGVRHAIMVYNMDDNPDYASNLDVCRDCQEFIQLNPIKGD